MKRTVEMTLGIIGLVFSLIGVIFGMMFSSAIKDPAAKAELEKALIDSDPSADAEMMETAMSIFEFAGAFLTVAAVLGLIFGLIAVLTVKKKNKLAGGMFIAGAVLVTILSVGFGFIPGILYLIAGIMCFVRKPKPQMTEANEQ